MEFVQGKVAIVLVNYNGWIDTIECLESLAKLDYPDYHVIVVDNDSDDDSVNMILAWSEGKLPCQIASDQIGQRFAYPPVPKPWVVNIVDLPAPSQFQPVPRQAIILVKSPENGGFARGNNCGTEIALKVLQADYIWYLNNDTVVKPDALYQLVSCYLDCLVNDRKAGIIGSKLLYYHQPDRIQAIGGVFNPYMGLTKHIGGHEMDLGQYDQLPASFKIDYIIGASMLVSLPFLEQVGYMSTDYFLYFEEIDWTIRGKSKGYEIVYCPKSIVYHKEGASTGGATSQRKEASFLSDYFDKRNRILITRKFYARYLPILYLTFIGVILNRIRRRKFNRILPIIKLLFGKEMALSEIKKY